MLTQFAVYLSEIMRLASIRLTASIKVEIIPSAALFGQREQGADMRSAAGLLAVLVGITVPVIQGAADETATFAERWPRTPMHEPTMSEEIRFAASIAKDDIKLLIESILPEAPKKSPRCTAELCQMLGHR